MKKSKRKNNKNHKSNKYNGYNAFGEPCVSEFVKIEKETAAEQYIELCKNVKSFSDRGIKLEYTIVMPILTEEEQKEFNQKVEAAMRLMNFNVRKFDRRDLRVG